MIWTPEVFDGATGEQLPYTMWLEGTMIFSDWGGTPINLDESLQGRGVEIRCIGYETKIAQIGVDQEIEMKLSSNELGGVEIFGEKSKSKLWILLVLVVLYFLSRRKYV